MKYLRSLGIVRLYRGESKMSDKEILQGKEFAIRAISVFRVKFNMEFTRQAVNFSIAVTLRFAHGEKFLNSFNDR